MLKTKSTIAASLVAILLTSVAAGQEGTPDGPPDYTAGEEAGTDPIPADEPRSFDEPPVGIEVIPPAEAKGVGPAVEELVVTAQKRAQDIQDVPISMTALTSQFIEDSGLTNMLNMSQYTPNVQINAVTDSRSTAIRIRGIGSDGTNAGIDPSVGVFIDGIYQGRNGASAITDFADIERIEVLRGPQGTLYGKNTAAGAINVVSKKPVLDVWEGLIEGQIGNYQNRQVRGAINIPLVDQFLAVRLSGFYVDRGAFDELLSGGGVNDANRNGARLRGLFDLGPDVEFILWGDYNSESSKCCVSDIQSYDGFPNLDVVFGQDLGSVLPGVGSLEGATGRPLPAVVDPFDRRVDANLDPKNDVTVWGVAGELNVDFADDYVLTFLNGYRRFTSSSVLDADFSSYDAAMQITDEQFEQWSSELRVTSPYGEDLEYVAGLFFYYSKDNTQGQTGIGPDYFAASEAIGDLFLMFGEPDENGRIFNRDTNEHKTWSYAFFGQATYHWDEWDFTLGLRGTYEEKSRVGSQISGFKVADAGPFGPDRYANEDFDVFNLSPMAAVQYYPTEDSMVFAKFARGFKSGGFNQLRTLGGMNTQFDDEKATDVEAGFRSAWFDRMITVNGTFFYTWYDDFQSQVFDGNSFTVTNAGSLISTGFETETMFVPHPFLMAGLSTGYTYARYTDFDNSPCTAEQAFAERVANGNLAAPTNCTQDLTDRPLDNAPEWSVSFYAQANAPIGEAPFVDWPLLGFLRVEYSYRDQFYLQQDLDENLVQPPVNLVNLRGGIRTEDDHWELTLWAMNLANQGWNAVGFDVPIVSGYAVVNAPPRTYGATLRYRWY